MYGWWWVYYGAWCGFKVWSQTTHQSKLVFLLRIDLIEQLDEVKELRLKMAPEVPLPSIELPSGQYIDSRSRVLQSNQQHYSYLVGLTEVKAGLYIFQYITMFYYLSV